MSDVIFYKDLVRESVKNRLVIYDLESLLKTCTRKRDLIFKKNLKEIAAVKKELYSITGKEEYLVKIDLENVIDILRMNKEPMKVAEICKEMEKRYLLKTRMGLCQCLSRWHKDKNTPIIRCSTGLYKYDTKGFDKNNRD